jgi:hypothetical protein
VDKPGPTKKIKKKRKETVEEPLPPVSLPSVGQALTKDTSPAGPCTQPEASIKRKKKGEEGAVSEPPNAAARSSSEMAPIDSASKEKKKKGKSKLGADNSSSVDPSTTARVGATEVKKHADKLPLHQGFFYLIGTILGFAQFRPRNTTE